MSEEIKITARADVSRPSETEAQKTGAKGQASTPEFSLPSTVCAGGLLLSFFLPWANFFGASPSGFDIQKMGEIHKALWLIPILSGITLVAGFAKWNQQGFAFAAGVMPFVTLLYWFNQLGSDLMQILTYGGYLSLAFGLALLICAFRRL